jgi:hypothetical protein
VAREESLDSERREELLALLVQRIEARLDDPTDELRPYLESPEGREAALKYVLCRQEEESSA